MSDSIGPLETATIEELMDEIKRRCVAGMIVISGHDPKDEGTFGSTLWGSHMWTIGACQFMADRALRSLRDEKDIEE